VSKPILKEPMKHKVLMIVMIIILSSFIAGYLVMKPAFTYLSGYLSKSEQVKAEILVIEGWLSDDDLKIAFNEIHKTGYKHIVTTGMKSLNLYFNISSNGYLIFYLNKFLASMDKPGHHLIDVKAYSEMGNENRAHFNLFINDSLVANFFVEKWRKKYSYLWNGNLKELDSIMVQFDNDTVGDFGDRNLLVKDICIDNKITIPYLNNSVYDMYELDRKYRTFNTIVSNAEIARDRLIALGVDSLTITAVSAERVRINRTLTSALEFRKWLKTTDEDIHGINIISQGSHSRRTWMTYNKVLDEKYKIGIISLPDTHSQNGSKRMIFKTLRETLGIIYYWFILIPY
jgi:hypothetical protein